MTAEDGVHEVAKFMKIGHHVVVLHEPWVARLAARKVADQCCLRQVASAYARHHGRGGEPLVLAFARVHVEVEAAHQLAALEDLKDSYGRVPRGLSGWAKFYFEQARGGVEHAGFHLVVGEIRPDRLRIEIERR